MPQDRRASAAVTRGLDTHAGAVKAGTQLRDRILTAPGQARQQLARLAAGRMNCAGEYGGAGRRVLGCISGAG